MAKNNQVFNFIRYANVWEDAEVALDGLKIKAGQTGAVVCSGGDIALAMLAKSPKKIYAFDINKTQLYCTELKIAAISCLSLDETKCLLGVTTGDRMKLYKIAQRKLSKEAQKHFDEHLDLIKRGIIHVGKFEHYFQMFRKYIIPITSSKKNYSFFSKIDNLTEQREFYIKRINTRRFRTLFKLFFGYRSMAKHGRDKSFFKYVDKDDVKNNSVDLKKKVEFGLAHTKNSTNPYFGYIANGNFTHTLPLYLRSEYYEKIRANLDKIELVYGNVNDLPDLKYDFFYLSDIFEYMNEKEFIQNIKKIEQLIKDNGRIMYWNMQNRRYIKDDSFKLDEETSQKLFEKNRAWFYRDLLIYGVKK